MTRFDSSARAPDRREIWIRSGIPGAELAVHCCESALPFLGSGAFRLRLQPQKAQLRTQLRCSHVRP